MDGKFGGRCGWWMTEIRREGEEVEDSSGFACRPVLFVGFHQDPYQLCEGELLRVCGTVHETIPALSALIVIDVCNSRLLTCSHRHAYRFVL